MIHEGEKTLRARAAAAISRRRLEARLRVEREERVRCGRAEALIRDTLGIEAAITALPVTLDGLEFTAEQRDEEWVLCLLQPCQSVRLGHHYRDCAEQTSTPIRCLADLGEALEAGTYHCAGCEA